MRQITLNKGKLSLDDVPSPQLKKGMVLVKVKYSCISTGTETFNVKESEKSKIEKLLTKLKDNPSNISKGIKLIKKKGLKTVFNTTLKPESTDPRSLGYSASGIVVDVGEGIADVSPGDEISCAGANFANHAEIIIVPRNLIVKNPKGLSLKQSCTITLGGIALQGLRRGNFKLGEFVVVYGLGLIGLLTAQMLKISGCRVLGIDIDEHRCNQAKKSGIDKVLNPNHDEDLIKQVQFYTNGRGADGVIFTAATSNPKVVSTALKICRRKAKFVMVGSGGDVLKRSDLYEKEIDYLISTSYGPGRYDNSYEIEGIDYPYDYVRWTENRNMEEYLLLLSENKILIDDMIEKVFPIEKPIEAYECLLNEEKKPIIALFKYSDEPFFSEKKSTKKSDLLTPKEILKIGLIGPGSFAINQHLPILSGLSDKFKVIAVCGTDGLKTKNIAKRFNISIATTNVNDIFTNGDIDIVLICTRHDNHATLVLKALEHNKIVVVEKPLAISSNQLNDIKALHENCKDKVMVGFNRQFSPIITEIKSKTDARINPMIINYTMNAGYMPVDHWIQTDAGGGRIIGEAWHIIDLFGYLTESDIENINVHKLNPNNDAISRSDNVNISIKYSDGSVANLVYTSMGNSKYQKEGMQIFFDGKTILMDDYKTLKSYGVKVKDMNFTSPEKGHKQEWEALYGSVHKTGKMPIAFERLIETTEATIMIDNCI